MLTGAEPAQPESEPASGPPPAEPAECTASLECPDGFECAGDVCVPSICDAAEGIASCAIDVCEGPECAAPSCSDGVQNGGETGVDCGGPCPPCPDAGGCASHAECAPGACVDGRCAEPSCDDGLRNQDESGPDCGGATCPPCAAGVACGADTDCEGELVCASATSTCAPASCQDEEQNGAELGVDCGGGECPGCGVGAPCTLAADCASSACLEGSCAEPSCDDGVRNGDEADVDCGGACAPCAGGLACVEPAGCESGVCAGAGCAEGVAECCQAPSCSDGVQNGDEAAVDCGEAPCARCDVGATCTRASECASNVCAAGRCAELCGDGVQNGDESDVDCGGSEVGCPRCGDGDSCDAGADCASGVCDAGRCVSCSDGVENGDEAGLDCGGSALGCPACPRCNVENSVDLGGTGNIVTVAGDGCARITAFPGYAPTQLDSYDIGTFPVPFTVRQECTALIEEAVFVGQFDRVAVAGLSDECPVILEFGGASAPLQVRWF